MSKNNIHSLKIGILGAGQLGLMLGQEASNMAIKLNYLDASKQFPASLISQRITKGNFKDYEDVLAFGMDKDVISIEIENVNTEALKVLETKGVKVFPQARIIETIKDKGLQKTFYKDHNFPTSSFKLYESKSDILGQLGTGELQYPFVQKSRLAGYDGKGVVVIRSKDDNEKIFDTPSVIEDLVSIDKELAIIIGRNQNGEIASFTPTEMVFNENGNLLDYLIAPADISEKIYEKCNAIAKRLMSKMGIIGILAIEFFLTTDGDILINEVAPRPHNSGHHTIESDDVSQYRMLLDILVNAPMRQPQTNCKAAVLNVLGEDGYTGKPIYKSLDKVLGMSNTFVHLYGKAVTKPLRKMGHITILGETKEDILDKISNIKTHLKVIA